MEDIYKSTRQRMEANWNVAGYTAPNLQKYPFLWLWDSCFHSLIWTDLGEFQNRALVELGNIFRAQDELGFIPHINYYANPNQEGSIWAKRWGRTHSSSITQPPMYGHTIAEIHRKGLEVPSEMIQKAESGLNFLVKHRKRDLGSGLIFLCHPWESGIDNSPRWDDYCEVVPTKSRPDDLTAYLKLWDKRKIDLLESIEFSSQGSPLYNPDFPVTSIGFNALVAFNILELSEVMGGSDLAKEAEEIIQSLQTHFSPELMTWTDTINPKKNAGIKTLDALLVGLVSTQDAFSGEFILSQLQDYAAFGGDFGPPSVHRQEDTFLPDTYWRGTIWPPMAYLFWVLCERLDSIPPPVPGDAKLAADMISKGFLRGVQSSDFSEYWNADTGEGYGARSQSWSGLIISTLQAQK